jgi:hypothetical protein
MSGLKHGLAPSAAYNQVEERARFEVMMTTRNRKEVNQIAFRLRESGKSWADVLSAVITLLAQLELAVSPSLLPPAATGFQRHRPPTYEQAAISKAANATALFSVFQGVSSLVRCLGPVVDAPSRLARCSASPTEQLHALPQHRPPPLAAPAWAGAARLP